MPRLQPEVARLIDSTAPRYTALKLLEGDQRVEALCDRSPAAGALRDEARAAAQRIQTIYGDDVELLIADRRYGYRPRPGASGGDEQPQRAAS